jgi:Tfp pilus assembly protein PilE
MLIKINVVIVAILSIIAVKAFAAPLTSEDKIKSCMAYIFASQSDFHQKNQTYTEKLSDLSLAKHSDCEGVKAEVKNANKKSFVVEVGDETQSWKIDSSKTMSKLN